jgi:hypothetical protein
MFTRTLAAAALFASPALAVEAPTLPLPTGWRAGEVVAAYCGPDADCRAKQRDAMDRLNRSIAEEREWHLRQRLEADLAQHTTERGTDWALAADQFFAYRAEWQPKRDAQLRPARAAVVNKEQRRAAGV